MNCITRFLLGLDQAEEYIEIVGVNHSLGVLVRVYPNRISIKFPDEAEPRWFFYDHATLYEKIDCKCKMTCFNFSKVSKRTLRFELEDLSKGEGVWTVRVVIIGSKTDNYLVEVVRSELLSALAFFYK